MTKDKRKGGRQKDRTETRKHKEAWRGLGTRCYEQCPQAQARQREVHTAGEETRKTDTRDSSAKAGGENEPMKKDKITNKNKQTNKND